MFGKKILFLITGYIAGNAVAASYSSWKKKTKKAFENNDIPSMIESFLDTQKRFITDIEKRYLTDENKEKLIEKKQDFVKLASKYTQEWQKIIQELQTKQKFIATKENAQWFLHSVFQKLKQSISQAEEKVENVQTEVQEIQDTIKQEAHVVQKTVQSKAKNLKNTVSKKAKSISKKVKDI